MANIADTDLTYSFSIKDKKNVGPGGYRARGTIAFGDNSLTYGTGGGLPLLKGKMGLPRFIRSFVVIGSSTDKYGFSYIPSTEKLQLLVPAGSSANSILVVATDGTNAVANATLFGNAGVLSSGAATANITTGVVAGAFTGSGSAELGNVAITTTTIHVEVEGY